jgi:hypothetical protein
MSYVYLVFFRYQKTSKNVQGIDFEDVTCKNICLFGKILRIKTSLLTLIPLHSNTAHLQILQGFSNSDPIYLQTLEAIFL